MNRDKSALPNKTDLSSLDLQPKLVSIEQARALLGGIGKTRVYEFVYSGDLVRVKVGARTCITFDSINRLVSRLVQGAS